MKGNTELMMIDQEQLERAMAEEQVFYAKATRTEGDAIPLTIYMLSEGEQVPVQCILPHEEMDAFANQLNPIYLLGRTIPVIVIGMDKRRNLLICSRKRAQMKKFEEMLPAMQSGQTFSGRVSGLAEFGAFVEVGNVAGLLHNMDYAADDSRASESLKIGDSISVRCKEIREVEGKRRIVWEPVAKHQRTAPVKCDVAPGSVILGQVMNIQNFPESLAAFVRVEDSPELDVLCPVPALMEVERSVRVLVQVSSVRPGPTKFARPRIRGKIIRVL